jgi:hypothetical protein
LLWEFPFMFNERNLKANGRWFSKPFPLLDLLPKMMSLPLFPAHFSGKRMLPGLLPSPSPIFLFWDLSNLKKSTQNSVRERGR